MDNYEAILNSNGGMHNDVDLCFIERRVCGDLKEFVEELFLDWVGDEGFESVKEWFECNRKDNEIPENLLKWWEEEILGGEEFPYIMTIYRNKRMIFQHDNFFRE